MVHSNMPILTYMSRQEKQRGFALLLSSIIASVVLAIGVVIMNVSISQLEISATARESEFAIQSSIALSECLRYERFAQEVAFLEKPGTQPAGTVFSSPTLACPGTYITSQSQVLLNTSTRYITRHDYTFEWGTPARCSSGQMYIFRPETQDINNFNLGGTSAGEEGDGVKSCEAGTTCTVLVVQGYNRPCSELSTSIFSVQRELTFEF